MMVTTCVFVTSLQVTSIYTNVLRDSGPEPRVLVKILPSRLACIYYLASRDSVIPLLPSAFTIEPVQALLNKPLIPRKVAAAISLSTIFAFLMYLSTRLSKVFERNQNRLISLYVVFDIFCTLGR